MLEALFRSSRLALSCLVLVMGCDTGPAPEADPGVVDAATVIDIEAMTAERVLAIEQGLHEVMGAFDVITVGAGVIKNGELVWTGYYGEQSPGVPASRQTLFDVASMTKTITAETILRLVAAGRLSLDESMAPYWIDPDLVEDPR